MGQMAAWSPHQACFGRGSGRCRQASRQAGRRTVWERLVMHPSHIQPRTRMPRPPRCGGQPEHLADSGNLAIFRDGPVILPFPSIPLTQTTNLNTISPEQSLALRLRPSALVLPSSHIDLTYRLGGVNLQASPSIMSSSMPIPQRRAAAPSSWSYSYSSSTAGSSPSTPSMSSKAKQKSPMSASPASECISPRRPSLLGTLDPRAPPVSYD